MFKLFVLAAVLLLGAACTESDLSTPEGRERDARIRAIGAKALDDAWVMSQTRPPATTICSGYTSTSRYISGGYTTLVCQ